MPEGQEIYEDIDDLEGSDKKTDVKMETCP